MPRPPGSESRDDGMEGEMIVVGVDASKRTHTLVAVDEVGRKLDEQVVATSSEGEMRAMAWVAQWPDVLFALEDCRHLTRRLEGALLRSGYRVVRVPTRMMAGARRNSRQPGKSDPIDALAVAHAALREPDLPVAQLDGPEREVKLLTDHRRDLVAERTRVINRLRWHIHELDPELVVRSRGLNRFCVIDTLERELERFGGVVAGIARELVLRCRELTLRINELWRELRALMRTLAPNLLSIPGCGVLSAAMLLGETADVRRFRSKDAYARFNGTAPIPVWSGSERVRLNRGGNRTANTALHAIAVAQARGFGPGKDYVAKQLAAGKTRTEALRLLRRHLSDRVFRALLADVATRTKPLDGALNQAVPPASRAA